MSRRSIVLWGAIIGGVVGGLIPELWHAGAFSGAEILFSTLGGLAGIWLAFRLSA